MKATKAPEKVAKSRPLQAVARLGLVIYGVVHLLVAWLAVQVATGDPPSGGAGGADKSGALQSIAANTGGSLLLWLVAVGLGVSALWQLAEAVFGTRANRSDLLLRAMNLGEAVLFGYLSFSAAKIAGGSSASSTDTAQQGLVGGLLTKSWGKPLVIALGVLVVLAALLIARHGLAKRFCRELDLTGASRSTRTAATRLGQVGYTALGVVYGGAGVLLVVAAVQAQPNKATGLDAALRTLAAQPFGTVLLLLVAAGLAAFAAFSFFDARYRKAD
jgi:energy-converting hydrogenase Eha subunit C